MKYYLPITFLLLASTLFSQKLQYPTTLIPDSLKINANAVIRLDQTDIAIASQRSMNIKHKQVVTIYNEKGNNAVNAIENYDRKTTVESISATVFDSFGNEIKKIKRKDFRDQSVVDGSTMFSDNRMIYLSYIPTQYPYTIIYESEVQSSNTAFIPTWEPLRDYYVSVEKAVLNVTYPDNLGFKKKESDFKNFHINKTVESPTQLSYIATDIRGRADRRRRRRQCKNLDSLRQMVFR